VVQPGETFIGLDFQNHLWIILSLPTAQGTIAVANLTTHGKSSCGAECVVVSVGEHPYVIRESCMYYRGAYLNPLAPLERAKEQGFRQSDPFVDPVLFRLQQGALASRFVTPVVSEAIRRTLRP